MRFRHALPLVLCIVLGCHGAGARWRVTETAQFGPANLYDYINGGAEYYLEKGFRKLTVEKYILDSDGLTATVDVYDMGTPEHAREVYDESATSAGQPLEVGDAGAMYPDSGYAEFCQGQLYVRIIAYDLASDGAQKLAELARLTASKLPQPSRQ